jgi:AcrR family transcriptional regulator
MPRERVRRKTTKQEDLLKAAERLFLQKGIRQVTVEEIVREAQVSKATFYKYFADKESLLQHCLETIVNYVIALLRGILEKGKRDKLTKEDFLRIFDVNEYERFFQSDFARELMQDYPDLVRRMDDRWQGVIVPLFHDLIRMAKVDGIVRVDVDPDVLLIYTLLVRKSFADAPMLPESMSMKDLAQKFYDLYLYGVIERGTEA